MTRRARFLGLVMGVLASGAMLGGCRWFRSPGSYGTPSDPYAPTYTESSLVVENGHQEGAMGEIDGYSGSTFVEEGYAYDGYAHVRLESQGSGWWVMSLVNINGATLDQLEPGVTYVTATSGVLEEGQPDVSVTGCSGPSQGNYTFDTQASRVEMDVEDNADGSRHVTFRAYFPDYATGGEELTTGSFDYRTAR